MLDSAVRASCSEIPVSWEGAISSSQLERVEFCDRNILLPQQE